MRVARSDYDHCLNFEPLHHEMQANPDLVTLQLKWEQSGGKQSLSPQDRFTSSHISFFLFSPYHHVWNWSEGFSHTPGFPVMLNHAGHGFCF